MAKMTPRYNMARRYISAPMGSDFFFIRRLRNRRERETGSERERRVGGRARTIADAITIFICANVNAPLPVLRCARIRRIGFQTKNGSPLRPRALLNNRYRRNSLRARCRPSGSICHACFKESRRVGAARSHIPIIRCNLTWIVESRVKPLKKYIRVLTDGNELCGR